MFPVPLAGFDLRQQFRHARHKRFSANHADVRMVFGLPREMLAAAEADFQPHLGDGFVEIRSRIAAGFRREGSSDSTSDAWCVLSFQPLRRPYSLRGCASFMRAH